MDPITQGLLGAAVSQSIFHQKMGRKAMLIGGLAGMMADADFLLFPLAPEMNPFYWHRHFSHSLMFAPIGALIIFLPFLCWASCRKEGMWKWTYLCAIAGFATHGLLDLMTPPGTMILWPFSFEYYALDSIAVIDPWYSLALFLGLLISLLKNNAWAVRIALLLATLYIGLGYLQNQRAMKFQEELAESRGHTRIEGRAFPSPANMLQWQTYYRDSNYQLYKDRLYVAPWGKPQLATDE